MQASLLVAVSKRIILMEKERAKTGLFVGLNKGFVVVKPKENTRKSKPSYKKGRIGR